MCFFGGPKSQSFISPAHLAASRTKVKDEQNRNINSNNNKCISLAQFCMSLSLSHLSPLALLVVGGGSLYLILHEIKK